MAKKKVSFWATKKVRKPVIVKFKRLDGSIAKFKATKIVKKPTKVTFYAKKKKRYKKW
jgi:hypothetical protein